MVAQANAAIVLKLFSVCFHPPLPVAVKVSPLSMKEAESLSADALCEQVLRKGCEAVRLTNGILESIVLLNGGHVAALRYLDRSSRPSQNVLWEAPWPLHEHDQSWAHEQSLLYGAPESGRFLAGFTGHAVCVPHCGAPTHEQASAGLGLHGEAAVTRWHPLDTPPKASGQFTFAAELPLSCLRLERKLQLHAGQSAIYVEETLYNKRDTERRCDWVEHVTFGHPFLSAEESTVIISAQAGITSALDYDGHSLLPSEQLFSWPLVPLATSNVVDLRRPFTAPGKGFIAGLRLDPARATRFLMAVNWRLRLGAGYCFRREDFPWMTVWEENYARRETPWNGNT